MSLKNQFAINNPSEFRFEDFYGGSFKRPLNAAAEIEPREKVAKSEKILKVTLGCRFYLAVVDRDPKHWKVEREQELEAEHVLSRPGMMDWKSCGRSARLRTTMGVQVS